MRPLLTSTKFEQTKQFFYPTNDFSLESTFLQKVQFFP